MLLTSLLVICVLTLLFIDYAEYRKHGDKDKVIFFDLWVWWHK